MDLRIRIPGWAKGRPVPTDLYRYADARAEAVTLRVNGQAASISEENGYALVRRAWRQGDSIELNLPMPIRRVFAHAQVKDNAGLVAIERGPLVYCAEGTDHGGQALNLVLPDASARARSNSTRGIGCECCVKPPKAFIVPTLTLLRKAEPRQVGKQS